MKLINTSSSKNYNSLVKKGIKATFNFWQSMGIHVTRNHFYEPIPDTRELTDEHWQKQSRLAGIDMNLSGQLELLSQFKNNYFEEYRDFPTHPTNQPHQFYLKNNLFETVDAEIHYCMIRHFKPRKVIEIGGGFSTFLSAEAILRNRQESRNQCELIVIEPYPNETLKKGFDGLSRLVQKKVQDVPVSFFDQLAQNDILFIDSSHTLKIGGDVQYEYLEIVPSLNPGVLASFHDIFLPADYAREWVVKQHCFWNEQYLLQAFLAFNDCFKVMWAGNYISMNYPEILESAISSYNPAQGARPGSFWVQRVK